MTNRQIYVTTSDYSRLNELLTVAKTFNYRDRNDLKSLEAELCRAKVVESRDVPETVVTMRTKLRFRDLDDGAQTEVTLVYPSEADINSGKISVISPIGTALLGYAKGDTIEWTVPAGIRRIKIVDILYQPEAAGEFDR